MLKVGYQMAVQTKWWYLKHRVVLIFVILSLNKIFIWWFQKYISSGSTMMQSRNITMFIPLFILYQFYSNVLFCFFSVKWSIKIMWLSIFIIFNFIESIMIIVLIKGFSSAKINTFLATRITKKNFSIVIQIWNIEYIYQGFRNLFKCSRLPIFPLRRLSLLLNIYNVYKVLLLGFIGTTK